ncbi:hypothetical protein [Shimia sp.]|uniref:hypothetical protein n=1 Tax=Shimia sp. TaxID=1954381 RepID=UPI0032994352
MEKRCARTGGYRLYDGQRDTYKRDMNDTISQSVENELQQLATAHAAGTAPRIERVEVGEHVYWIKRPERLNWRFRIQKGDPRAAFERERLAFHEMNAAHAPVPVLCVEGDDYLVLPDSGMDLRTLLQFESSATVRRDVLLKAGRALGQFHSLGFSHGRPSPKDMCLSGDEILLLDFERYKRANNTPKGHARDLVVFAFNVTAHSPIMYDDMPDVLDVYRQEAPDGTWELAQVWCRRVRWAEGLTKPAQWRKGNRGREFKAIPRLFDLFLGEKASR